MSPEFCDSREWKIGDSAQKLWARIVAGKGAVVLPTYDMVETDTASKAPMLFTNDGLLVAPDLLVMSRGKPPKWNEVKAKAKPGWYRIKHRWEHGFDYSLVREYQQVQNLSGAPVYIVVNELASPLDNNNESPLTGPEMWFAISLSNAMTKGERRPTWPGGRRRPNDRGRRGEGGWLWARNDMFHLHV